MLGAHCCIANTKTNKLKSLCNLLQVIANLTFKELNLSQLGKITKDSIPNALDSFLLHKVLNLWHNSTENKDLDAKQGSYERLLKFVWTRSNFKKAIMTIPYNSTLGAQRKYLVEDLYAFDYDPETKVTWYSGSEDNSEPRINSKDATLVVSSIKHIIYRDLDKISKLSKYLTNIAKLLAVLELPITWRLPTGLTVIQSYMQSITTSITPFTYSKTRLNLKSVLRDSYHHRKQVRAPMPNLIHSLDATSIYLLYNSFSKWYPECQFFSVHNCYRTTTDKVTTLKILLASIYTELYLNKHYLTSLDEDMFITLYNNIDIYVNKEDTTVNLPTGKIYTIHDINWVVSDKPVSKRIVKKIEDNT